MNGAAQVRGEFDEEPRQKDRQPVRQVAGVNGDEVDHRLDEHAKHFALRLVEHAREYLRHLPQVDRAASTHTHTLLVRPAE